jgi:organic hydroperoxide reductase OsmC/OhrA
MTTTESPAVDNGVNVEALLGAREHMTEMPALAQFTWRADCEWVNGTHSRTTVEKFSGAGGEQTHRQPYSVDTDHPELFASADNGPTPPELLLIGLAGCLTAGVASVATNRGVQLRSVKATVEAGMDLAGILGIDGDVRNGFSVSACATTSMPTPRGPSSKASWPSRRSDRRRSTSSPTPPRSSSRSTERPSIGHREPE